MIEWFEALSVAGKMVFVCVAVPSTLVLVIQTVMTFFGFSATKGRRRGPARFGRGRRAGRHFRRRQ